MIRERPATWRHLHSGRTGLVLLSVAVGAGTGLGAVAFRWLITAATRLFTGTVDVSAAALWTHPTNRWVPWLGAGFIVIAPMIGGLLYGPVVDRFAREARGHGVPEVMYAVSLRGGRIGGRVAVVKALASAVCIGSGGSVGREGPIVQIGSALGSTIGRWLHVPEPRLKALVACGAAGGIAATFNAPIAGVFFALELLLRDFAAEAFGGVVLSAVVASVIGRAAFGSHPFLSLPPFSIASGYDYGLYIVLGLVAGLAGVVFTKVLYGVEDACDRLWRWPESLRPAVGGLFLGLLLLALPQLYGVGYPVLEAGVAGRFTIAVLILLLVGKMVATSLTLGIGGSGGVFAPTLFCGAMLGAAYGDVAHLVMGSRAGPVGAFALVGMGAMLAGATRAPITAVIILFELTGEYSIILPLMLAIVLATGVSHFLSPDTIYTLKLRRRGVDLDAPVGDPRLATLTVGEVMDAPPDPLDELTSLREAALIMMAAGRAAMPVVHDGRLNGVVTARAVSELLSDDDGHAPPDIRSLVESSDGIGPEQPLREALTFLLRADPAGVPVEDVDGRLVGWLSHQTLLRALASPAAATALVTPVAPPTAPVTGPAEAT